MAPADESRIVTYPGPKDEPASKLYTVQAGGKDVFVYTARVREEIAKPPGSIWTHVHNGPTEWAAMAYFDFAGSVEVAVTPARPFKSVTILPSSYGVQPTIAAGKISFTLDRPRQVTVLLDGSDREVLHLFANPLETDPPDKRDPNVIYFGPGAHETGPISLKSGQTVYVAGGAVVRGTISPEEKGNKSAKTGLVGYAPLLHAADAENVTVRGRGIIDGGLMPHAARSTISLDRCRNVRLEGIIIRNSPNWAVNIHGCESVQAVNVKQISGRLNSDGINPVSSRKVRIADCFIRNHDDSIAVKTTAPDAPAEDILVERCVLWNDWGYALGITYETRADIRRVTFRDCDVIHGTFAALGIHMVDSGTVSDVTFEDIRVDHARDKLIFLNIGKDMWATDKGCGHIKGVRFRNVRYVGPAAPPSQISGRDAEHLVEDVTFEDLRIGGKVVTDAAAGKFSINEHTRGIVFKGQ